ncbi:MAG TPA: hypothetical protein DEF43_05730 [Chloroflexus aurantiacus]|nr:MAG: hypothetical protein D6716_06805 [Chloroflexota bacterium]HBW66660.1 hypothetical protein [Chloroflexus aurantiacus]
MLLRAGLVALPARYACVAWCGVRQRGCCTWTLALFGRSLHVTGQAGMVSNQQEPPSPSRRHAM